MLSLSKCGLSEYAEKQCLWSFNLDNSEIFRLSFEDIFLETLDTYTKKNNPPSAVLGGGGAQLIVYNILCQANTQRCLYTHFFRS